MIIKPFIEILRSDVRRDRWSFGGNIAYERNNNFSELYLTSNFLYWNLAVGIHYYRKKGSD